MATGEHPAEPATIRLLGGTAHRTTGMVLLELVPTALVALGARRGCGRHRRVRRGTRTRGELVAIPVGLLAALAGGAIARTALVGAVTARLTAGASVLASMRGRAQPWPPGALAARRPLGGRTRGRLRDCP
ncbi:MAG TPA: hypothetical protein VF533_16120 [Solirubrobacteraceae bacterium]|jgi:hypothetical protein